MPGVKHGRDDQEPGCDGAFADAQEDAAGKETAKACRGGVAEQCDGPYEDVDAENAQCLENGYMGYKDKEMCVPHPFCDGETLQGEVLWPLEAEEEEVEYRP